MSEAPTLVLVDGSSYLYRAFFALPPLANSRGEPTGAIYGVINMLLKLIREHQPQLIAVVVDAPGKTFRDDLFAEYKATRKPMPDDLRSQIEPLHQIVRAMGLPLLCVDGVEADDVIGTLARRAAKEGIRVIISTGDKDMTQLIDERTTLINTMTGTVLDREGVKTKFDVYPEQIIDYLALVGDSSDNIPGVPKVGPKTAAKLLAEFGTLDNLLAKADTIKTKVGENIRASLKDIELSRKLATIHCDVPLEQSPADLVKAAPDTQQLRALYERMELNSLLRQLQTASPAAGASASGGAGTSAGAGAGATLGASTGSAVGVTGDLLGAPPELRQGETADLLSLHAPLAPLQPILPSRNPLDPAPPPPVPRTYETVFTLHDLERWIEILKSAPVFAFDTETTSLDYMAARIVGVSFSAEPGHAAYVPFTHNYPDAPAQVDRDQALALLKPLLEDPLRPKVCHHGKYDAHVLGNHGIQLNGAIYDSMLESYVLNSTVTRHDMDSVAGRYLGVKTIKFEDVCGKGRNQITFNRCAIERASEYAAEDADITLQLHKALWPQIVQIPKLKAVYEKIEQPLIGVLQRMEHTGVLIDRIKLGRHSLELMGRIRELEAAAHREAGVAFNLDSPKQLQDILFNRLKLPVKRKTPTGQPSTAEDVLEELAEEFPLPKLIMEHRGLLKLKTTYCDKLPEQIDPHTGRVHTSYHQAVAATGRLSSADPNLQNIPIRTQEGRRIRQAFIAPPGSAIVSADYSQIELRIMAHLSKDESLLKAFREDADVHSATAAEVFNVPLDQVTSEQRRYAKTINFGLIYGMSAFGLAQRLGIEREAAQSYINLYFERYPGVRQFMDDTRLRARNDGFVETVFGRRLYLQDIRSPNAGLRQYAERSAINAPMQGTAADIIKRAMIDVDRWIAVDKVPARLVMQVHDELVFEVAESEIENIVPQLRARMTNAAELMVPLKVQVGTGHNWDEAH